MKKIKPFRSLTRLEAGMLRLMVANGSFQHRGKFSAEKAAIHMYGSACPKRRKEVRRAIQAIQNSELLHLLM